MTNRIKFLIKKTLAFVGLYHPSLGIKISQDKKAELLLQYKRADIKTFVETGTHQGWMIDKIGGYFEKVYSIELDEYLFNSSQRRFHGRENIKLFKGDSSAEIKKVLADINEPVLFWLDAHKSGAITVANSPIISELGEIFAHKVKKHLILIDDARHFNRKTIRMIKKTAKSYNYTFHIEDGIFRLTPKTWLP